MSLSYLLGVSISRSCLKYIKLGRDRLWMLLVLQILIFVFLFINALLLSVETLIILAPMFVVIGLLAGATYVKIFFEIRNLETLKTHEKDMASSM